MANDFITWFKQFPVFTRTFTSLVFFTSLLSTYGILNPYHLVLVFEKVFKLQIWRLFTTFIYAGTFNPSFLFTMMMAYFTANRVDEAYKNKPAELLTMLTFCAFCVMIYSLIYGNAIVLHNSFVFALVWVVCKLDPETMVSLWGFPIRSAMLPWVLVALNVIQGQDPIKDLIGVAAGHTYIYIKTVLPGSHGYRILENLHPRAQKLLNLFDYYYPSNVGRANIWG